VNGFGDAITPAFADDRELVARELDLAFDHPVVERCLRKEDAILHVLSFTFITVDAPRAMDEMLTRAADDARTARVLELRAAFEARTGSFSPRDSFFEPRSAAFWDDALTSGGFGRELLPDLSAESAAMVEPFARAHRGLFRVEPEDDRFLLVDEWSGAELVAEPAGAGLRDALERVSGLVDGRVVGDPVSERIVLRALSRVKPAFAYRKEALPK
jgi:hypothetical protein